MASDELPERVRAVLVRDNPREASGEWSVFDVARELLHGGIPTEEDHRAVREAVKALCPSGGRYVGGVSGHLYTILPPARDAHAQRHDPR